MRLFPTLIRFDAVYHGHFKCNRNKLIELPALWGYARDLYQTPGFGDTIDFVQIKQHYYIVHRDLNPHGIVPKLHDTFRGHGVVTSGTTRWFAPDCIHPNTPGHEGIRGLFWKGIVDLK